MKNKIGKTIRQIIDSAKNLVFILRYLWRSEPLLTFFSLIVFTGVGLTPIASAYVYKLLIDSFTKGTASGEIGIKFILIVVTYIVLIISNELISHLKEYVNLKLGMRMSHSFSLMYIEKFRDIDLKYLDDPEFADIAARSRSDANLHPEELLFQFIDILENLISVAAYSVVVIRYSPLFMLFCVASLVITFFNHKENEEKRFSWEKNATSARRMSDYFDGVQKKREYIPEVRLFGLSSYFEDKYQASQRELLKNDLKLDLHERASEIINNLIRESVTLGCQLYLACLVIMSKITLGDYTFLVSGVECLIRDGRYLVTSIIETYYASKEVSYLREFLSIENSICGKNESRKPKLARNSGKHCVEFRNVSFRYSGAAANALNNVSFVIEPGETVALVGDNGSGKSTIMKLLLRLYDPSDGEILIDGKNLKEYDVLDYYSKVGAMFQNCINYSFTVEESVRIGDISKKPEESGDRIDEALLRSGLYESEAEIRENKGKETSREFCENSFEPSGGELQKLALARTFFRNGELVILDEPSSSLDALSEKKLFEQIFELKQGVTTLMITHRLSDMDKCDRIIVLGNGTVIENGTHPELITKRGYYYEMYQRQSQHYM